MSHGLSSVGRMARRPSTSAQGSLTFAGLDHRSVYGQIRNYLAGQAVGATRDRALLDELLKVLFCKHFLETAGDVPEVDALDAVVGEAYRAALLSVADRLPQIFLDRTFSLSDESIAFIHGSLSSFDLDDPRSDLVGDAFELFTGSDARGQEGQFFTPHNAVGLLVDLADPKPGERVIDPACGAGGFLSAAARRLVAAGADPAEAVSCVHGIDKDRYLASLAATRLAFVAFTRPEVTCADSLGWRTEDGSLVPAQSLLGKYDVVLTNPPFGSRIIAASAETQLGFDLGHRWKLDAASHCFVKLGALQNAVPPQVLFIERCLSLVKPGGRIGIVVPESLISGRNYRHVVSWVRERADIQAVIGMPEALFKTSGKGGTHTKTCLVLIERKTEKSRCPSSIFMAETKYCGNDSRGRRSSRDELPTVAERFAAFTHKQLDTQDHLGYAVPQVAVVDDILAPRYYNPEVVAELATLDASHDLVTVGNLVAEGVLEISTGHEVGAAEYGGGLVPFVRTSDISNWEMKLDPKHGVSEDVYQQYAAKQDVREGDILMVRDGTYLVGTCAFVTKYDTQIVFQSHILKFRVRDPERISPFLLLAALSSQPVRRQVLAKRFTQDIIDTLGNRYLELVLPLPKDKALRERVTGMVKRAVDERVEARELARQACFEIIGTVAGASEPDLAEEVLA